MNVDILLVLLCALSVAMVLFTIMFAMEMDKLEKRINSVERYYSGRLCQYQFL